MTETSIQTTESNTETVEDICVRAKDRAKFVDQQSDRLFEILQSFRKEATDARAADEYLDFLKSKAITERDEDDSSEYMQLYERYSAAHELIEDNSSLQSYYEIADDLQLVENIDYLTSQFYFRYRTFYLSASLISFAIDLINYDDDRSCVSCHLVNTLNENVSLFDELADIVAQTAHHDKEESEEKEEREEIVC